MEHHEIWIEQFLKSVKRFSEKNCGENKKLEQSVEPSETKTALERFLKSFLLYLCFLIAAPLSAASSYDLIPHRGIYELQLEKATNKTGINHLSGRMVYEFSGSHCAGFTTRFRYVSRIEMEGLAPRIHDQQTSLFEAGDSSELRVINKNYIDRNLSDEIDATARSAQEGIVVDIIKPEAKTHHLASALFPIAQMMEMLQNAEGGVSFYQTALYDNFETGDKVTQASIVIGKARSLIEYDEQAWPITVSYFDDKKNLDGLPTYSSQFLLDRRGISHDIMFDYGDFSMRATLSQLDIFEKESCDK